MVDSLNFVMTYKVYPVMVQFRSSVIGADALSKSLVLDVLDVFGSPVAIETIEAKAVKRIGRDGVIYSGMLEGNSLDLSSQDGIVPGLYSVDFSLNLLGQAKPIRSKLNFVVHGKIEVVNVGISVSNVKQVSLYDLTTIKTQNAIGSYSAASETGDFVHLGFSVASVNPSGKRFQKPHQVFIRFTHKESGNSANFAGIADGSVENGAGSKYKVSVSLAKEIENFKHLSGTYIISLLTSDVSYETDIEWVVGPIELLFPAIIVKDFPLYTKALMYTSDNTLVALPEIAHVMRPDSKRASAFMSSIFTVLAGLPLIIFVTYILSLAPNLSRLKSVSSIAFVICLLITLFLYAGYWLALEGVNFYDTIKYLCFLVPITLIIGNNAVNSVTQLRVQEGAKK